MTMRERMFANTTKKQNSTSSERQDEVLPKEMRQEALTDVKQPNAMNEALTEVKQLND